tara:strand:- start:2008 stop:2820 length:813 start_codon:yes stop_codon:yes gene_type:complete
MAELYESLSAPSVNAMARSGSLVEAPASDLSKVASRAQLRQQRIIDRDLSPDLNQDMRVGASKRDSDRSGLGDVSGQPQGVKGITNSVPKAAVAGSMGQGDFVLDDGMPLFVSAKVEARPLDMDYTSLSPTQRGAALRDTGMDAVDFAVNETDGAVRKSRSGAAVLAFKLPTIDEPLFLAEDGAPAHAALIKAVEKSGVRAIPANGAGEYEVGWRVHPQDRGRFMKMLKYLEAGGVTELPDGKLAVVFTESNALNREFMRAPFGSRKKKV